MVEMAQWNMCQGFVTEGVVELMVYVVMKTKLRWRVLWVGQ